MKISWRIIKQFTAAEWARGDGSELLEGHLEQICKLLNGGQLTMAVMEKFTKRVVQDPEPIRNEQYFVFRDHPIVRIQTYKNILGAPELVNYMVRDADDLQSLVPKTDKPSRAQRQQFNAAKERGDGKVVNAMKKVKRIIH
jgi:hypothetical protein